MATPPVFVANTVLTASQMNKVGTWKITSSTSSGSGVALDLSSCFSSSYANYRLYITGSSATAGNLALQLLDGATVINTNYVWNQVKRDYSGTTNTVTSSGGTTTNMRIGLMNNGALGSTSSFVVDILNPYASDPTMFSSMCSYSSTEGYTVLGAHYFANSYDGLRIFSATNISLTATLYGMTP